MTYVATWTGFVYLAVVLDVWSRRVVGWSIGQSMTADLVLSALTWRYPSGARCW
jgi:putative transposase